MATDTEAPETDEAAAGAEPPTPGSAEVEAPPPPPTAPAVPTREDIRRIVRERLERGEITDRDVLTDMYASMYAIELQLREFGHQVEAFGRSPLGRMLGRRAEKEARKHGNQE